MRALRSKAKGFDEASAKLSGFKKGERSESQLS